MFSYVRIYIHTYICTKALKWNLEMGNIYRHITLLKVVTSEEVGNSDSFTRPSSKKKWRDNVGFLSFCVLL